VQHESVAGSSPTRPCPLCGVVPAATTGTCTCGFELATYSPALAIERQQAARRRARPEALFGVFMSLVGLIWLATSVLMSEPLTVIGGALTAGFGGGLTVRGVIAWRRSRKLLAAAHAMRQLPEARLLE
jgi:hypothetical protein